MRLRDGRLIIIVQSLPSMLALIAMAAITIRQLDENIKSRLRVRAAHNGRSMEEEAREILRATLTAPSPTTGNLADRIRQRFAAFGGIKLELPRGDAMRPVPDFTRNRFTK